MAEAPTVEQLLANYRLTYPHGPEGDRKFRQTLETGVLELRDDTLREGYLGPAEINDLLEYVGWNLWDSLGARATEGESGLIPRQEYEAVANVRIWARYPEFYRLILDAVGDDGVVDLARRAGREVGNKANVLHAWCCGTPPTFGRGLCLGLGLHGPDERVDDLRTILHFDRLLYRGLWDDPGPMYASMRNYALPLLEGSPLLERFRSELVRFDDPEQHRFHSGFNASTELLGFMLYFDNRNGLCDTGPYPVPGGGFAIVRDHFLYDPVYSWFDVVDDLPHALTQVMVFEPDVDMSVTLYDFGTTFTEPRDYLPHLKGMTVYARDRWDTPVSDLRLLDEAELRRIGKRATETVMGLYQRIAAMETRDKIMAGAQTYYVDFLVGFARMAGVWDRMVDELGFFEMDPLTSRAYDRLVEGTTAAELMPKLIITGEGFAPVSG